MNNTDLAQAVLAMNLKLRRAEGVAAYEMHTARKLDSGQNISLNDSKLRQSQLAARRHNTQHKVTHNTPKPGDTITNISQQPKHSVRDMYLVTAATPHSVTAQKILHPITQGTTKFMSKTYTTHPKHTRILHSPPQVHLPATQEPALPPRAPPAEKTWSAIPRAFWESDSDDDDYDDHPLPFDRDNNIAPALYQPDIPADHPADPELEPEPDPANRDNTPHREPEPEANPDFDRDSIPSRELEPEADPDLDNSFHSVSSADISDTAGGLGDSLPGPSTAPVDRPNHEDVKLTVPRPYHQVGPTSEVVHQGGFSNQQTDIVSLAAIS